jgi:hypothetical protein
MQINRRHRIRRIRDVRPLDVRGIRADKPQPADTDLAPPPAIGCQVVQDTAQVAFQVRLDPMPAAKQPLQRGLQQVFPIGPIPGQRNSRPDELVTALGQELIQVRAFRLQPHASPPLSTAKDESATPKVAQASLWRGPNACPQRRRRRREPSAAVPAWRILRSPLGGGGSGGLVPGEPAPRPETLFRHTA